MEHEKRKYAINQLGAKRDRVSHMLEYFHLNKAYRHAKAEGPDDGRLLETMRARFEWYRRGWRGIPAEAVARKLGKRFVGEMKTPPLCVDLETAAVCDLACPFCFRQAIVTPDKMMEPDLAYRVIDQAAELGVPSMKFNWRGEPLMNPETPKFVAYAKKKGILETLINTNATYLTREKAAELIDTGLDVLIYSFDGGSRETYNKNRPGRFKPNDFETVYGNIRRMAEVRKEKGAVFPFTKIQMIITKDTYLEKEKFYNLFHDCVDEVSTGIYMERGGNLDVLTEKEREALLNGPLKGKPNPSSYEVWKGSDGTLYVEDGRLPCEQLFQRLMVSYDGRVFMCCYDWGNEHPVGYVSDTSFKQGDSDYDLVLRRIREKSKGFDMMRPNMPSRRIKTAQEVKTLKEIWDGAPLRAVRERHVNGLVESIEICKKCTFVETYRWKAVPAPQEPETQVTIDADS
jgi:MoaA/NifB/PqqE/SkfB family radical SAM enzyme